jgi:hypothetical protein
VRSFNTIQDKGKTGKHASIVGKRDNDPDAEDDGRFSVPEMKQFIEECLDTKEHDEETEFYRLVFRRLMSQLVPNGFVDTSQNIHRAREICVFHGR